jgi:hypothetical protein
MWAKEYGGKTLDLNGTKYYHYEFCVNKKDTVPAAIEKLKAQLRKYGGVSELIDECGDDPRKLERYLDEARFVLDTWRVRGRLPDWVDEAGTEDIKRDKEGAKIAAATFIERKRASLQREAAPQVLLSLLSLLAFPVQKSQILTEAPQLQGLANAWFDLATPPHNSSSSSASSTSSAAACSSPATTSAMTAAQIGSNEEETRHSEPPHTHTGRDTPHADGPPRARSKRRRASSQGEPSAHMHDAHADTDTPPNTTHPAPDIEQHAERESQEKEKTGNSKAWWY